MQAIPFDAFCVSAFCWKDNLEASFRSSSHVLNWEVFDPTWRASVEAQLAAVFDHYSLPYPTKEGGPSVFQGMQVGFLLRPSAQLVAAIQAAWSLGVTAVPLPFEENQIALETAGRGVPSIGGSFGAYEVARPSPVGVPKTDSGFETPREFYTDSIPGLNSLLARSPSIRRLQQHLVESRVSLLLVDPALASLASALSERLSIYVAVVRSSVLLKLSEFSFNETEAVSALCGEHQRREEELFIQMFVRQPHRCGARTHRQKWTSLALSRAGSSECSVAREGPRESLASLGRKLSEEEVNYPGEHSLQSKPKEKLGETYNCKETQQQDFKAVFVSENSSQQSEATPLLHLSAGSCFGRPRVAVLDASKFAEDFCLTSSKASFSSSWICVDSESQVVVCGDPTSMARSKLLLGVLLPAFRNRAQVAVVATGNYRDQLPLPARLSPQRKAAEAAASEDARHDSPRARAEALWDFLEQETRMRKKYSQPNSSVRGVQLFVDLETADALLKAWKDRWDGVKAAKSSAFECLAKCCVCTDEKDFFPLTFRNKGDTIHESGAPDEETLEPARPRSSLSRLASILEEWRLLLPTTTEVEHLLSLSELGPVALLHQDSASPVKGKSGAGAVTDPSNDEGVEVFVGNLLPGVSAWTDPKGALHFQSHQKCAGYFGRTAATAAHFADGRLKSSLVGRIGSGGREVWLSGSVHSSQSSLKRPLAERLQQFQWSLPQMERLPEGYVHKVPITGKEWGNYHAKKRNWKRVF